MPKMVGAKRIMSWGKARQRNFVLNPGDDLLVEQGRGRTGQEITFKQLRLTPEGGRLTANQKKAIWPFIEFINGHQRQRHAPAVEREWSSLLALKREETSLYSPRHPYLIYAFEPKFGRLFKDLRVLDIGCVVEPPNFPFYQYYRKLGAAAIGIDISIENNPEAGAFHGDVRRLDFSDRSFDFVTIPMIFGIHNPAPTVLEIVAGLSELYRVLDRGIIHIADPILLPGLVYIANMLGFRYFYNQKRSEGNWNGIPVGSLLIKRADQLSGNPFQGIIDKYLLANEIIFSQNGKDALPLRKLHHMGPDLFTLGVL